MSVRTMAAVWERSQHSGTNLLMLLAIADFADDDGMAFPSVGKLATKCRMSKRNAQDRLRELSESGELTIKKNQGPPPKFPNLFMVNLKHLGVKPTAPVQHTAPVQFDVSRGAVHCAPGVKPTAPKPSYNHQEPSTTPQNSFESFWLAYPKKKAKGDAQRAWSKLKPNADLTDSILKAIEAQKTSEDWTKENGKFIPYPATWLNSRRWEDESPEAVSAGTSLRNLPGML